MAEKNCFQESFKAIKTVTVC